MRHTVLEGISLIYTSEDVEVVFTGDTEIRLVLADGWGYNIDSRGKLDAFPEQPRAITGVSVNQTTVNGPMNISHVSVDGRASRPNHGDGPSAIVFVPNAMKESIRIVQD